MSEYPRDEFDDVPEDGTRQGAHRGHNPNARAGSQGMFLAILIVGVLALVLGAVAFVNAPRTAREALPWHPTALTVSSSDATTSGVSAAGTPVTNAPRVGAVMGGTTPGVLTTV